MALSGLIVREPWIGELLAGRKRWELRSTSFNYRGDLALIRKGSGLVVGMSRLVDCLPPLTAETLRQTQLYHRVPLEMHRQVLERKWLIPWVLEDVYTLPSPVGYRHPSGAVKTVILDAQVEARVRQQLARRNSQSPQSYRSFENEADFLRSRTPIDLHRHTADDRKDLLKRLPHIGGKSFNTITDADLPRLGRTQVVNPTAEAPGRQDASADSVPIVANRWPIYNDLLVLAIGSICFLALCGTGVSLVIWAALLLDQGILPALLSWSGFRWLVYAGGSALLAGFALGIVNSISPERGLAKTR